MNDLSLRACINAEVEAEGFGACWIRGLLGVWQSLTPLRIGGLLCGPLALRISEPFLSCELLFRKVFYMKAAVFQ